MNDEDCSYDETLGELTAFYRALTRNDARDSTTYPTSRRFTNTSRSDSPKSLRSDSPRSLRSVSPKSLRRDPPKFFEDAESDAVSLLSTEFEGLPPRTTSADVLNEFSTGENDSVRSRTPSPIPSLKVPPLPGSPYSIEEEANDGIPISNTEVCSQSYGDRESSIWTFEITLPERTHQFRPNQVVYTVHSENKNMILCNFISYTARDNARVKAQNDEEIVVRKENVFATLPGSWNFKRRPTKIITTAAHLKETLQSVRKSGCPPERTEIWIRKQEGVLERIYRSDAARKSCPASSDYGYSQDITASAFDILYEAKNMRGLKDGDVVIFDILLSSKWTCDGTNEEEVIEILRESLRWTESRPNDVTYVLPVTRERMDHLCGCFPKYPSEDIIRSKTGEDEDETLKFNFVGYMGVFSKRQIAIMSSISQTYPNVQFAAVDTNSKKSNRRFLQSQFLGRTNPYFREKPSSKTLIDISFGDGTKIITSHASGHSVTICESDTVVRISADSKHKDKISVRVAAYRDTKTFRIQPQVYIGGTMQPQVVKKRESSGDERSLLRLIDTLESYRAQKKNERARLKLARTWAECRYGSSFGENIYFTLCGTAECELDNNTTSLPAPNRVSNMLGRVRSTAALPY